MRRLFSLFLCTLPCAAWAQSPLTEIDALRLGLSREPMSDMARATVEAAEAEVLSAGQRPNPTLDFNREQFRSTPRSAEQSVQFGQTFDTSGRRDLRRDAAVRRSEAAAAGNSVRRIEIAAEIRRRFYEVVLKQEIVRATRTWTDRFARMEAVVQRLARGGEASGYDRRRLVREHEGALARLAMESANLERAHARLAAAIGAPGRTIGAAEGALLPSASSSIESALMHLDQRPDLRVLASRAEAADLDGRAAARGGVPDVTLAIGPKWIDSGVTRDNGVIVTFSVPLPLFDRGQAGQKRAAAEALSARAEHRLVRDRAEGELRGLHRQLERMTATARDYRAKVVDTAPELLRIAEAAYRGGESTILELLDAYRGALESELTALDLEWKAREARIEFDQQSGSTVE